MIKKEIFIGFIVGILANSIGILLYILLFSDLGIEETIGEGRLKSTFYVSLNLFQVLITEIRFIRF
ncbi:hypothetical protein B4N84_00210 [Flavobacterium sp. IR1]|nr:hypothetical protein B4N84_00210 [Flavobacterium sp. IR1]